LVRGGGFGLVLHAVTDGPPELAPAIAQCVLLLADLPATRCFFKAGNDIEVRPVRRRLAAATLTLLSPG
jgi:hypothetical protein